jgi:hypothetical protein
MVVSVLVRRLLKRLIRRANNLRNTKTIVASWPYTIARASIAALKSRRYPRLSLSNENVLTGLDKIGGTGDATDFEGFNRLH